MPLLAHDIGRERGFWNQIIWFEFQMNISFIYRNGIHHQTTHSPTKEPRHSAGAASTYDGRAELNSTPFRGRSGFAADNQFVGYCYNFHFRLW